MNGLVKKPIRMNKRMIAATALSILLVLALVACVSTPLQPGVWDLSAYPTHTPSPLSGDYAQAAAAATLAAGHGMLVELSYQATMVRMDMEQSANAAAQATLDHYQRQMMELSIQGTEISENLARAAATQQFIQEQTRIAENTTATAQSQAATETQAAYWINVTQTAQAQALLDTQAAQTAQVNASQTAYPLTATPLAALQAEIVRAQKEFERRALWDEFVVTPLRVILYTLIVVLLIVGSVKAYQRLMPVLEQRLLTVWSTNDSRLLVVDAAFVDPVYLHPPQLPRGNTPNVEIVGPTEPSVINWIIEAEERLRFDREQL